MLTRLYLEMNGACPSGVKGVKSVNVPTYGVLARRLRSEGRVDCVRRLQLRSLLYYGGRLVDGGVGCYRNILSALYTL